MAAPSSFSRLFILTLCLATMCASVEEDELDSVLTVLRARGYTLFSNAIATSDVVYEIVKSNSSFTLFAPTDSTLYALDMAITASEYTSALRCHVVPLRLSFNQIRHFPLGYSLRTLARNRRIQVQNHRSNPVRSGGDDVIVGDVRLISPGLFYSRHIAVHGLAGILSCPVSNSTDVSGSDRSRNNTRSPEMKRRRHGNRHRAMTPTPANTSINHSFISNNSNGESPSSVNSGSAPNPAQPPTKSSNNHSFVSNINTVESPSSMNSRSAANPAQSPANSPEIPQFPPETVHFPPAYNIWPGIPIASTFPHGAEPPAQEYDHPPAKEKDELSMMGVDREEEEREIALIHSISPADLTAITESEFEQSQPSNEKTYHDCPTDDGFDHLMPRGYCSST